MNPKPRYGLGVCQCKFFTAPIESFTLKKKPSFVFEDCDVLEGNTSDVAQVRLIELFGTCNINHDIYDTYIDDIQQS